MKIYKHKVLVAKGHGGKTSIVVPLTYKFINIYDNPGRIKLLNGNYFFKDLGRMDFYTNLNEIRHITNYCCA